MASCPGSHTHSPTLIPGTVRGWAGLVQTLMRSFSLHMFSDRDHPPDLLHQSSRFPDPWCTFTTAPLGCKRPGSGAHTVNRKVPLPDLTSWRLQLLCTMHAAQLTCTGAWTPPRQLSERIHSGDGPQFMSVVLSGWVLCAKTLWRVTGQRASPSHSHPSQFLGKTPSCPTPAPSPNQPLMLIPQPGARTEGRDRGDLLEWLPPADPPFPGLQVGSLRGAQLPRPHVRGGEGRLPQLLRLGGPERACAVAPQGAQLLLVPAGDMRPTEAIKILKVECWPASECFLGHSPAGDPN